MKKIITLFFLGIAMGLFTTSCSLIGGESIVACNQAGASSRIIKKDSLDSLRMLYSRNPKTRDLAKQAKGVLVFPRVTKVGLGLGFQGGNGMLFLNDDSEHYFRTSAASYGFQLGVKEFALAFFLMDDESLRKLDRVDGWEIGASPSLVLGDRALTVEISTTSVREGIYVFTYHQAGIMASGGLQGAKIRPIKPGR